MTEASGRPPPFVHIASDRSPSGNRALTTDHCSLFTDNWRGMGGYGMYQIVNTAKLPTCLPRSLAPRFSVPPVPEPVLSEPEGLTGYWPLATGCRLCIVPVFPFPRSPLFRPLAPLFPWPLLSRSLVFLLPTGYSLLPVFPLTPYASTPTPMPPAPTPHPLAAPPCPFVKL
jgi:hypothetical protein